MSVVCVLDESIKKQKHSQKKNYWDVYTEEILDELGIDTKIVYGIEKALEDIYQYKCIILTDMYVSQSIAVQLDKWVENGGILIGLKTRGLDDLFGIYEESEFLQADDEFTINGYITISENMREYLPIDEAYSFTLPVISNVRKVKTTHSAVIGEMLDPVSLSIFSGHSRYCAVSVCSKGKGYCYYFAYNLAQTLCVIHQGRPVNRDWDGDGMYRSGDGIALTSAHDLSLPYADYHLYILQKILDRACLPAKHFLPPKDNGVADLLLHYGGDDEADPSNVQRPAMEKMKNRNLPYHFNIMPKKDMTGFAIDKSLYNEIIENGQECSIHFNFVKTREFYTQKELEEQLDLYESYYGKTPVASVNHCLMFTGWTEQARWASARGIKGDNGRSHTRLMPDPNPINVLGTAFGTTYPHFVYDDFEHDNKKLPYVYIPIVFYEARVRLDEHRDEDIERIRSIIDRAKYNSWTMAMFFHPVYITRSPECNEAIDQILEYIHEKKYRVIHMGTDQICQWWFDRSESKIKIKEQTGSQLKLTVSAKSKLGLTVRLPDTGYTSCIVSGKKTQCEQTEVSGRSCLLINVPYGEHEVVFLK